MHIASWILILYFISTCKLQSTQLSYVQNFTNGFGASGPEIKRWALKASRPSVCSISPPWIEDWSLRHTEGTETTQGACGREWLFHRIGQMWQRRGYWSKVLKDEYKLICQKRAGGQERQREEERAKTNTHIHRYMKYCIEFSRTRRVYLRCLYSNCHLKFNTSKTDYLPHFP